MCVWEINLCFLQGLFQEGGGSIVAQMFTFVSKGNTILYVH